MEYLTTTQTIIGCAYLVYNKMGYGFLESVYEKSLLIELNKANLSTVSQQPINVHYEGQIVGKFIADIIVEDSIILELKSVKQILPVHEVQLVNYLKATQKNIGLLLNFSESTVEVKRKLRELPTKSNEEHPKSQH